MVGAVRRPPRVPAAAVGIGRGRASVVTTVAGMPPSPVDPDRLLALGAALSPLRECVRSGADEVLALYPEVGDRETQSALDSCLDQVADLMRELDASATDLAERLRIAGASAGTVERAATQRLDEQARR